jgi:hypothetical protein
MSKILVSIAALGLMGAASLPLQANAAERHDGVTNAQQSTEVSAQRRWRRHYGYYAPRRYWGPRYGYYAAPGPYYGYGYPYGYYRPGIGVGIGPFGFRVF